MVISASIQLPWLLAVLNMESMAQPSSHRYDQCPNHDLGLTHQACPLDVALSVPPYNAQPAKVWAFSQLLGRLVELQAATLGQVP